MPSARVVERMDGAGAACPVCGSSLSKVIETRAHNNVVLRRRRCRCSEVFTTAEQTIDNTIWGVIVKGEGFKAVRNDRET